MPEEVDPESGSVRLTQFALARAPSAVVNQGFVLIRHRWRGDGAASENNRALFSDRKEKYTEAFAIIWLGN